MKKIIFFILGLSIFSCKTAQIEKKAIVQESKSHLGVYITDTHTGKVLFDYQGNHNFVPASNTKIITLYAALKTLGDTLPAFRYRQINDTLFILGTGDPTLFHPDFSKSSATALLEKASVIVLSESNSFQNHYGQGWAWDDYSDYYQAELSSFPIYGNIIRAKIESASLSISPSFFQTSLKELKNGERNLKRDLEANIFYFDPNTVRPQNFKQEIPFKTSFDLTAKLLADRLRKPVLISKASQVSNYNTAYSVPKDTVLRKMMWESDNFLAEQLLLLAGNSFSDSISSERSIKNIKAKILADMGNDFKWVDGSGLSRYNLFSPEFFTEILNRMYAEFGQQRVFSLMSIGGKAGTLRNKYKGDKPYVFAKTGSMGGVYNESGYMITKSGRLITYSVMKNNFLGTVAENGKKTMEFMEWIRNKF